VCGSLRIPQRFPLINRKVQEASLGGFEDIWTSPVKTNTHVATAIQKQIALLYGINSVMPYIVSEMNFKTACLVVKTIYITAATTNPSLSESSITKHDI
jgi:hypothetical protein